MSDLISRQAVLYEIDDVSDVCEEICQIEWCAELRTRVMSLPSVDLQPTCNQLATTERNLINREDAINCIKWGEGVTDVIEQIKSLPSADRPTGKWLKRQTVGDVDFAYCSKCGAPIIHGRTSPLWSYCPNCGAEMKGENK